MLKAKLVVVGGDAKEAEINLKLPTVIGRAREVNLTLPHPLVSRKHCELFEKDGSLHVRDLKSLNGTYINSRRIDEPSVLEHDQLLTIGNVTFRAVYRELHSSHDTQGDKEETQFGPRDSVIELDKVASADADSKIDMDLRSDSVHKRPTSPGKKKSKQQFAAADGSLQDDLLADKSTIPQASIVAALRGIGVGTVESANASISEIQNQLPEAGPVASGIEGLSDVVDPSERPGPDQSFHGIDDAEIDEQKVDADDSSFGSFIRKLPR